MSTATPSQLRAVLAFAAACERLRNSLSASSDNGKPPAGPAERQEAYQVIVDALEAVRDAYDICAPKSRSDLQYDAGRRGVDGP